MKGGNLMAITYGLSSQMNLQKNVCEDCEKEFITGVEISKENGMICPYCGSRDTYREAMTTDDTLPDDLGCVGLMIETEILIQNGITNLRRRW